MNLTVKQDQIVGLVACGYTDKAIANELGISYSGVRRHMESAFRKLGVTCRAELVAIRKLSEEYVATAIRHLKVDAESDPPKSDDRLTFYSAKKETLRVQFFFPGISNEGFNLLFNLRRAQLYASHLPTERTEHAEATFEQLKEKVESLFPHFTPVQRIILRRVFFPVGPDAPVQ